MVSFDFDLFLVLKRASVDQVPLKAQTSRHLGHKGGGENRGLALVHMKTLGVTFKGDHSLYIS